MTTTTDKVAAVGLGNMGLPLAVAFGGRIETIGFDINEKRVASIQCSVDLTREVSNAELKAASSHTCTTNRKNWVMRKSSSSLFPHPSRPCSGLISGPWPRPAGWSGGT